MIKVEVTEVVTTQKERFVVCDRCGKKESLENMRATYINDFWRFNKEEDEEEPTGDVCKSCYLAIMLEWWKEKDNG